MAIPFFIEEFIRSLIETKQIVRENNHWRAVSEDAKVSLPNTLRGVLGARIDRLPETIKTCSAKCGGDWPFL